MKKDILIETPRLLLRKITFDDLEGMFELDSDPLVHQYIENKPVKTIEESRKIIESIHSQYERNGIGRLAVILKDTNEFIGWSGLKLDEEPLNGQTNFYDLGYRYIPRYWRKSYGYEAAQASLDWGFESLKLEKISGAAQRENIGSKRILEKVGLKYTNTFTFWGKQFDWLELNREEYLKNK